MYNVFGPEQATRIARVRNQVDLFITEIEYKVHSSYVPGKELEVFLVYGQELDSAAIDKILAVYTRKGWNIIYETFPRKCFVLSVDAIYPLNRVYNIVSKQPGYNPGEDLDIKPQSLFT